MARKIAVEILGDASSLERAFRKSSEGATKFNRQVDHAGGHDVFGRVAHSVGGLAFGLAGVGGLAEAAKTAFDRMQEGQKTAAQTAAVLRSTHEAAGVSADDVDKLAQSLLNKTGIDDEAIKSGENLLLTFTGIRNEVGKGNDIFNRATTTVLNMSTALGESTKSAAIQLGKALQDPVKGITALRRVGVAFTDDQKKQIKTLVDSGHTMQAQKIILGELTKEFGGSATAAGKTLPGQLNILKTHLLDLGGTIAAKLMPSITHVIQSMIAWISQSKNQKMIMDIVKGAVSALKTGVDILRGAFGFLSRIVGGNANAIKVLVGAFAAFKIISIATTIGTLATSFLGLGAAEGEAAVATEGLSIALGPAVLVAGALAAGYALGSLLLQIGPVRDAINGLADDITSVLGIGASAVHQIKVPSQATVTAARHTAGLLEASGTSRADATKAIVSQYGIDPAAAKIISGEAAGRNAPLVYNIANMVVNTPDPRAFHETLARQTRSKPRVR